MPSPIRSQSSGFGSFPTLDKSVSVAQDGTIFKIISLRSRTFSTQYWNHYASRPVGIFWDVDNIRPNTREHSHSVEGHVAALRHFAGSVGELTAFTAFGNASTLTGGTARKTQALSTLLRRQGVGLVRTNVSKNAADTRLIAAARGWIAAHGAGACIVLVTGDKDFGPLAAEARRRGLAVVAATFTSAPARQLAGASDMVLTLRTGEVDAVSPRGAVLHRALTGGGRVPDSTRRVRRLIDLLRSAAIRRSEDEALGEEEEHYEDDDSPARGSGDEDDSDDDDDSDDEADSDDDDDSDDEDGEADSDEEDAFE